MIRVLRLLISPGHNFFEHYGRPAGRHPVVEVDRIECVAGRGIRGDRFFDYKPDYKGQITFFSAEIFRQLQRELGAVDADFSATRRNVLLEGADLDDFVGRQFEIQGVRFDGVEKCQPCYWMNNVIHPKAEAWLQDRGGLRARILTDGILRSTVEARCQRAGS
jgi:MOSC domain-containing protein YiiM